MHHVCNGRSRADQRGRASIPYSAALLVPVCFHPSAWICAPRTDPGAGKAKREESFMRRRVLMSLATCAVFGFAAEVWAQQPAATPPQGPPPAQYASPGITLEQAKKAVDDAEAEAKKNGWIMAIAVVSNGGWLVHFSKMDNTQLASVTIAQHKAKA